jgi:DNA helicase-2/ATP-dependent DNA helicase PcrA
MQSLNPEQYQAATHTDGALMIVAGAGTGKTQTLTHRIHYLIQQGIAPASILAITFTNKAAKEMKERVLKLLAKEGSWHDYEVPFMSTFHGLGAYILRQHGNKLGIQKSFSIIDAQDQTALIKQAMKERDIDPKMWEPKNIKSRISRAKNNLITADEMATSATSAADQITAEVWRVYDRLLTQGQGLDFDDLLIKSFELLDAYDDVREYYQTLWSHIHIDEYQDTNTVQYRMAKILAAPHDNICVVGDTDQNIYSWRGADFRNMLNFEKDFTDATVIILKNNYRSTKVILDAADEIIAKNTERIQKELVATKEDGPLIKTFTGMSGVDEAYFIAREAKSIIREGINPSEIAILYRTNFQSRILEEAFLREDVPYQLLGVKFFDRKEVKDIIAYVRAALNRKSHVDIMRSINTPKRGIGKATVTKILSGDSDSLGGAAQKKCAEYFAILDDIEKYSLEHTPAETVTHALRISGMETSLQNGTEEDQERLANIKELVSFATRYNDMAPEEGLLVFLEDISLMSDQDTMDSSGQKKDAVKLMTIHAAKGLEFHTVFIAGLEQGLFPSERGDSNKQSREEERRLMYVAVTRAKHQLYLTRAHIRQIFGQETIQSASEFLGDIPQELFEDISIEQTSQDDVPTMYLDF